MNSPGCRRVITAVDNRLNVSLPLRRPLQVMKQQTNVPSCCGMLTSMRYSRPIQPSRWYRDGPINRTYIKAAQSKMYAATIVTTSMCELYERENTNYRSVTFSHPNLAFGD